MPSSCPLRKSLQVGPAARTRTTGQEQAPAEPAFAPTCASSESQPNETIVSAHREAHCAAESTALRPCAARSPLSAAGCSGEPGRCPARRAARTGTSGRSTVDRESYLRRRLLGPARRREECVEPDPTDARRVPAHERTVRAP